LRVALVHDWLTGMRGGERVLDELCGIFPDADLYTLVHVPGATSARIEARRIFASPLSRLPGAARHYRKLLPLFPWAIERFRLEGYDLVLSTSHAVAKGIQRPPDAPHLSYCFTPMRYVWDQADAYLGRGLRRALAAPLVAALRRFDLRTSGPDRVTRFVAISETVRARIARCWNRDASVVYPPVDVERLRPDGRPPDDFYLLVGGFVPYKREDVAIEAFRALGRPLVVAGDGPSRAALAAGAPANVRFLGRVPDAELARLYARCRALVYPQDEDFGIVAVEAQACGRPVIALGRGGAAETVLPLGGPSLAGPPTGLHFPEQTPDALVQAVHTFEGNQTAFDPTAIRTHAERFSAPRFRREIRAQVDAVIAGKPPVS
jgi:glycosyltransferase involved in cell wall biosynthesis